MAGTHTLTFTDAGFESEVLRSDVPVLVDFWADWCMPCRALGPIIDELASEYHGRMKVGKLDTEANQHTAIKYSVQSIPTIILFQNGEIKHRWLGVTPKKEFKAAMDALLK
ncbi:MAG: thioredoxin [Phycisphaerae bacterium]|nr:thioredoxin [Phycisphaerae bacterium]